jgi:hypothetical protein
VPERESRRIFGVPVVTPSRGDRQESRRFLGFPVGERDGHVRAGDLARALRRPLRWWRDRGRGLR